MNDIPEIKALSDPDLWYGKSCWMIKWIDGLNFPGQSH